MRVGFTSIFAALGLAVTLTGCEPATTTPPAGSDIKIETPRRDIDVDAGPGGVDVDVDRKDGKKGVDVDVDAGGVDVKVDGGAVRDRIQERRAARAAE
jgi:hypothetical protein